MNMSILGIVIVLTQGDFQSYKLLSYDGMVRMSNKMFTSRLYLQWLGRERGKHVNISVWGACVVHFRIFLSFLWYCLSAFDIFQSLLIFLVSVIYLENFISDSEPPSLLVFSRGLHQYSAACNSVQGFEGIEANLALATSIFFWFLFVPTIYEIANILVPGVPAHIEKFDAFDKDKRDFKSWFGIHRFFKYFSFGAPDLIWAYIANGYIRNMTSDIPAGAGFYVDSIGIAEAEEIKKASNQRTKIVSSTDLLDSVTSRASMDSAVVLTDDTSNHKSRLIEALQKPPMHMFRIESSRDDGFIALFVCKCVIRGRNIFNSLHVDKALTGQKYIFIKIQRDTGEVVLFRTYDVYSNGVHCDGRNAKHLADELNQTSDKFVVIVATTIDLSLNHLQDGLPQAIFRCGGSKEVFGTRPLRRGYVLIGVPGCGESKGFEEISKKESSITVEFCVFRDGDGFRINENISSTRKYLQAPLERRTYKENMEWKLFKAYHMPNYYALLKLETSAINDFFGKYLALSGFVRCLSFLLSLIGVGHIFTSVGQRASYVFFWKIIRFFQVALGIWTEDMVELYQIHDAVHEFSAVWHDPFIILEKHGKGKLQGKGKLGTDGDINVSITTALASKVSDRLEFYEKRRMALTNNVEFQHKLRHDYGTILYAIIAPRAAFLQLIPYVSVLSIFASFTAANPLFVFSASLVKNLKPLLARNVVETNILISEQNCDKLWKLKEDESNEESYTIPIPETLESPTDAATKGASSKLLLEIQDKNALSRKRQREVLIQGKLEVRKWEAYVGFLDLFLNESRLILYVKGVFKCIVSILLLKADSNLNKLLSLLSLIVLFPFALATGFSLCIAAGGALGITDAELYRELGWIVRTYNCLSALCCRRKSDGLADVVEQNNLDKVQSVAVGNDGIMTINPLTLRSSHEEVLSGELMNSNESRISDAGFSQTKNPTMLSLTSRKSQIKSKRQSSIQIPTSMKQVLSIANNALKKETEDSLEEL